MINSIKNEVKSNNYILVAPTYNPTETIEGLLESYKKGLLHQNVVDVTIEYLHNEIAVRETLPLHDFMCKLGKDFNNHIILAKNCLNTQLLCTSLAIDNNVLGVDLLYNMFKRDYGLKDIIAFLNNTGTSVASVFTNVVSSSLARFEIGEIDIDELRNYVNFNDYFHAIEQLYITRHR